MYGNQKHCQVFINSLRVQQKHMEHDIVLRNDGLMLDTVPTGLRGGQLTSSTDMQARMGFHPIPATVLCALTWKY